MHYKTTLKEAGKDSRKLWGTINEIVDRKQCRHKMPDKFVKNENTISGNKNIANAFNKYFASIGKQMADSLPNEDGYQEYLTLNLGESFILEPVDREEVSRIMRNQKPKLSCGVDTINNKIVKLCHEELGEPMTIIINKSLASGTVPAKYKIAKIIPLYKKNEANDKFMTSHNLLCDYQYGFRNKSQTNHVIQYMMNYVTEHGALTQPVAATFIDLSKAFDCLQYDKLFEKMKYLGFHKNTINWFRSYLSNRRQMVEFEGTLSSEVKMQLGVPQGSIFGPILFLIYVNDINKSSQSCSFTKFADDTTVLSTGTNIDEAVATMNSELVSIDRWFRRNKLNLNLSKTRYMILNHKTEETKWDKIGEEYLERIWEKGREKSFKLVGIWVDEGLTWDHHRTNVAEKLTQPYMGLQKPINLWTPITGSYYIVA